MEKFDHYVLTNACQKCIGANETVFTDHYLCTFSEVKKLFTEWGLGSAFTDSAKAVKKLEIRRVTGARSYYRELRPLLVHERQVGETDGTSAVVTLHRILGFAVRFLQGLQSAVEDDRKFQARQRLATYNETLSPYQGNLTQSAVKLALVRVSGRRGLLTKLHERCHGEISANQVLRDIASKLQSVHNTADGILQAEMDMKNSGDGVALSMSVGNGRATGLTSAD